MALALGALAGWVLRPPASRAQMNVSLAPPPGSTFVVGRNYEGGIAVSPDGRMLAFVANTDGRAQLWVKQFDSPEARLIAGTDGTFLPFWSPDSGNRVLHRDKLMRGVASGGCR
jgi:hypothetical protein